MQEPEGLKMLWKILTALVTEETYICNIGIYSYNFKENDDEFSFGHIDLNCLQTHLGEVLYTVGNMGLKGEMEICIWVLSVYMWKLKPWE